jgi:Bacterial conjugation TrbI-like protein
VDFSDPALARQPGYGVGQAYQHPPVPPAESTESEELRKPSLVFVGSTENSPAGALAAHPAVLEQNPIVIGLPPGTRLVARLESAVSTAVKEPVVAVIEYNYEHDGEIVVPAGAKAAGQLRQADRSGYVDIKFDTLEMPDGSSEKMDGAAMDLRFEPLKGSVSGKKTGTKFLVSAFTGLGTVAAYLVGNTGSSGFYGPVSESALLREQVASNVGTAGDQELNQLALSQHVVVTVPGNTRFYIVLESGALERSGSGTPPATVASTGSRSGTVPSLDELRQLLQLRQELSEMYQQAGTPSTVTQVPPQ